MKHSSILLLSILFATVSYADEAQKYNCTKPVIPNPQASDVVTKYFNKHVKDYKTCVEKYVEIQRAVGKSAADVPTAAAANEAAEVVIKEYNGFMTELDERNKQAGEEREGQN